MNGIILVDKPKGITSFEAVRRIRKILNVKSVGHNGTLDPLATGLLTILVGKATKLCDISMAKDKTYLATICLGAMTDTFDSTGIVIKVDWPKINIEKFDMTLKEFVGTIDQIPPVYSAIKIGGKRAYEYAREGKELTLEGRKVFIHSLLRSSNFRGWEVDVLVKCSKGTYIRSLVNDIGQRYGSLAYMTDLRRTSNGDSSVKDAYSLDKIESMVRTNDCSFLLPMEYLFEKSNKVFINERSIPYALNGVDIDSRNISHIENDIEFNDMTIFPVFYKNTLICLSMKEEKVFRVFKVFKENLYDSSRAKDKFNSIQ